MDDIQYYHSKAKFETKGTYAVSVPSKEQLADALKHHMLGSKVEFKMPVGISKLHPNDMYSKKIGRQVASAKLEDRVFYLHDFYMDLYNKSVEIKLIDDNFLELTFKYKPGMPRVFFMRAQKINKKYLDFMYDEKEY